MISFESFLNIRKRNPNVALVKYWKENDFLVYFYFNQELIENLRKNISSYKYVPKEKASKIHVLDLKRAINLIVLHGYEILFDLNFYDDFYKIKKNFEELKEWKTKKIVNIEGVKRKLKEYQIIGAQYMFKAKKVLNADVMGLGKSIQTIGAILLNKLSDYPSKTLLICPTSVKWNWKHEFEITTDELKVCVLDSNHTIRQKQLETINSYDVVIISYNSFIVDFETISTVFKPNILVIDECHRLSNKTNKITQSLLGGRKIKKPFLSLVNPHSIYLLSGTPIINKIDDIYTILKILDPGLFEYIPFKERFMKFKEVKTKTHRFSIVLGYKNEEEFKNKIEPYIIRRTKDQVLNELPPITFKTLSIELSPEERKVYDEFKNQFRSEMKKVRLNLIDTLKWFSKAQLICNSLELLPELNSKKSSKLEELENIVKENIESDVKFVIFTKYKKMLDIIVKRFEKYKPIEFHGELNDKERDKAILEFKNDDNKKIFVATLGAGGVGINLTTGKKFDIIVIMYDRWYSATLNTQAISRSYRLGQERPVEVIILRTENTIEEHIEKLWTNKELMTIDLLNDDDIFKKLTFEQLVNLI